MSDEGTSYQIQVPASGSWKTELLKVANFKQPSWVTSPTPLDLTKIHDVMFTPTIDAVAGGSATLEINNCILYGYDDGSPIVNGFGKKYAAGLAINRVTPQSITVSIPDNGTYTLSIFTINGKKIRTIGNRYFTRGAHSLAWNGSALGSQVYLIVLQGNNSKVVKKTIIQ